MEKRVEILSQQEIFHKAMFRIEEAHLRHERYDGSMSKEITRLNLERGDSAAAILHHKEADTVILTEQFRYPTYQKGPGWLLELPAGSIDKDSDSSPEKAMQREIMEEIGYSVEALQHISTFYLTPGGSSERIYLYYASVKPQEHTAKGGGLTGSGEDIRTVVVSVDEALAKMKSGEIADVKTIVGLQWLQMQRLTHDVPSSDGTK